MDIDLIWKMKLNIMEREGIMEPKGTNFSISLPVPSVQELAKEPLIRVPARYIRPDQDSPIISPQHLQVPIIDMERLLSKDSMIFEIDRLHVACRDWGFFQLINHGVSSSLLENVKNETKDFFEMPLEEKKKYGQKTGDLEGFGQLFVLSEDQKLDWADMFYMITLPTHLRKPYLLPKLHHKFRDAIEEYSKEVEKVCSRILMFIAKALKMEEEEMEALFKDGLHMMRMNYYPPCPQPEQVIGLTPHSDATLITFLLQLNEVDGLQIKKDGVWIPIIPHPNTFVVNVGDAMQILTNGLYESIEHRAVVNAEKERISIATFVSPCLDKEIGPARSLITQETPARFTRVTVADYMKNLFSRELYSKRNIEQYYI